MLVVPPSGQNWNQWSVQFEFSNGAIWWENLELMLVVSSGQNWNQYGVFNLNCPFYWIFLLCSWRDKSSYRSNAWVRCASGNVFYLQLFEGAHENITQKSNVSLTSASVVKTAIPALFCTVLPSVSPWASCWCLLRFQNFATHIADSQTVSTFTFLMTGATH